MNTVAFIPVKLNNERLPGKNTKTMDDGKVLISFLLETLVSLKRKSVINEIVVYCSDSKITEYLSDEVKWMKRPGRLDTQKTKSNDIIRSFIDDYEADIYAMCHATSPFISGEHIADCIHAVQCGKYDSAFCASEIRNFLWQDGQPLNFKRDNYLRTQDLIPVYAELPTPYVFTKQVFEKTGGRTGENPFICKCSLIESIDIDLPDDFAIANAIHMAGIDAMDLGGYLVGR